MELRIPELSLIVLMGASSAGKSSFAKQHFKATQIISSDACRGLVSDDESSQEASADAFELLHFMVAKRLKRGLLTVVDATNLQAESRKRLLEISRKYHFASVVVALDIPERILLERHRNRTDRDFSDRVIQNHYRDFRNSLRGLDREFKYAFVLGDRDMERAVFNIQPTWNNKKQITGPFDIIGDVHGCFDELLELLEKLGYKVELKNNNSGINSELKNNNSETAFELKDNKNELIYNDSVEKLAKNAENTEGVVLELNAENNSENDNKTGRIRHELNSELSVNKINSELKDDEFNKYIITNPEGRTVVFVGDLVDRGPNSPEVLRLVMQMCEEGKAWCVVGNHDDKLKRYLDGKDVKLNHGLEKTAEQLKTESVEFKKRANRFLSKLISHYVFDDGKLVVAHAGLREDMQGRMSGAVRSFCMYGETTGEIDSFGLPVRINWAADYRGKAMVIFGHTPVPTAEWLNNTMDIDTGCVFGGKMTALRYPERQLVDVPARAVYAESARPFLPETAQNVENTEGVAADNSGFSAQQNADDVLDISEILGKQAIETRLMRTIVLREEQTTSALETMSRFGANPKWLAYLPPTMSPSETSSLPDFLEHPKEAFQYYRNAGVPTIVCEEKHMGSRAVVVVCQSESVAAERFGVVESSLGTCYTRTGRTFFTEKELETEFLKRINVALTKANFWDIHKTNWVILDCELMPWSAKAQGLIQSQYAATGTAAKAALSTALASIEVAKERGVEIAEIANLYKNRAEANDKFVKSYQNYCKPTQGLEGYVLAPFHILATEGAVHIDKNHVWHMDSIADFCQYDTQLLLKTPYKIVNLDNDVEVANAMDWWLTMTENGGEGMVVKPLDFVGRKAAGDVIQPAVKCRGREYLRIIYGAEYTLPKNLERLKQRGLNRKRKMALQEFALGIEALERFVRREPLRKTHQCVFGVLAMESEDVDPRL
jgi:protein phosphatase